MTLTKEQAIENVYMSLQNGNQDIDAHISALKPLLDAGKEFIVDPAQLPQNNRQGRKMMQSYFKKRGINVAFKHD